MYIRLVVVRQTGRAINANRPNSEHSPGKVEECNFSLYCSGRMTNETD